MSQSVTAFPPSRHRKQLLRYLVGLSLEGLKDEDYPLPYGYVWPQPIPRFFDSLNQQLRLSDRHFGFRWARLRHVRSTYAGRR